MDLLFMIIQLFTAMLQRYCGKCGLREFTFESDNAIVKSTTRKLSKCARCKNIFYCSRKCQKSHWTRHKNNCIEDVNTKQQVKERYGNKFERDFIRFRDQKSHLVKIATHKVLWPDPAAPLMNTHVFIIDLSYTSILRFTRVNTMYTMLYSELPLEVHLMLAKMSSRIEIDMLSSKIGHALWQVRVDNNENGRYMCIQGFEFTSCVPMRFRNWGIDWLVTVINDPNV